MSTAARPSVRRRALLCLLALQVALGALVVTTSARAEVGVEVHITHGGLPRAYRLYVPAAAAAVPRPAVVIALHGLNGTPSGMQTKTGLDSLANEYGFVTAYPSGRGGSWNAGTCCGTSAANQVDDVGFLAAVIADIRLKVPRLGRVFVTGFSTGGMMAYRFACSRPGLVTAIAPVAATLVSACAPTQPVHVLSVNGRGDATVPYAGTAYSTWLGSALPAAPRTTGRWERSNRCTGLPTETTSGPVVRRSYATCAGGSTVRFASLADTGHRWPTAEDGYAATQEIWRYFSTLSPAVAGTTPTTTLTTRTTASRVVTTDSVTITGRVTGRYDVVLDAPVAVDVLTAGTWRTVSGTRTNLDGRFRITLRVTPTTQLRMRYMGAGVSSAAIPG
jgi:polyhydroxybutyrate depolymerase